MVDRLSVCLWRKTDFILDFSFQLISYMKTSTIIQRSIHFVTKPSKDNILVRKKACFPSSKEKNVPKITQIDEDQNKNEKFSMTLLLHIHHFKIS